MEMIPRLRVAVISDLHAFASPVSYQTPSYLDMSQTDKNQYNDPMLGLKSLIDRNQISADILLCAGDIGDKAIPAATSFGWDKVNEIKGWLGASDIIATAGNHDVDSRYKYNDYDAKGMLQSLTPAFPGLTTDQCDRFWSRNFAILEGEYWRIVTLNSAAYHGAGGEQASEYLHGRVSNHTVAHLKKELEEKTVAKPLNILLCHHHPIRNNRIEERDYSEMAGGDGLVNELGSGELGQWIIIHGHKHYPRITYATGGSTSPIIFSAGSFCAQLYPELGPKARNQFYLIDFPIDQFGRLECSVAGKVNSWDWISMRGWQKASRESGIPAEAGFGYRCAHQHLVNSIVKYLTGLQEPYSDWSQLVEWKAEIDFLTPDDKEVLIKNLQEKGVQVLFDDDGVPVQVKVKK